MSNKQEKKINIFYNTQDESIVIQYNSNGIPNLHSITPQGIMDYQKENNDKSLNDFIVKQKVDKPNLKNVYIFKKKVVIVGENTNYKSSFSRDFKIDIFFNITNEFFTIFENSVTFKYCNLSKDISLSHCIFNNNINIFNCSFQQQIDFSGSVFQKDFVCVSVNFCNRTSFHNATFKYIPIFASSCFVNPQMIDFIGLTVKNVVEFMDINKENKSIVKETRDSYRAIKNVLILQNNLLDASNYHRIELYFKEIELNSQKPKIFSKDWIDLWQLKFYRVISEHHTDLLKITSWLVVLIGMFATTLFFTKDFDNNIMWYAISWAIFGISLSLLVLDKIKRLGFFALINLLPCAWLVAHNPNLIFGVASLFADKQENILLNFVFLIYTILFILLTFSLQKTARRNSIIPI
ncbi:hypothetical protein [Helicobacter sp. T3_23-1059]